MKQFKSQPAFLTLTTVIVLGLLAVMIVFFVVISSVDLLQQGLHETKFESTYTTAEACAEDALLKLNSNGSFSGETIMIYGVACTSTVTGSGAVRGITVEASQGDLYFANLELSVNIGVVPLSVLSWERVL